MSTATYTVVGMTCEHCVRAVREEVGRLEGVRDVDVDLGTGRLAVTGDTPPGVTAVRAAVDEAGYELVDETT